MGDKYGFEAVFRRVRIGEYIRDFRGDWHRFQGVSKLPGGPSQGKILVEGREMYPSVFSGHIDGDGNLMVPVTRVSSLPPREGR